MSAADDDLDGLEFPGAGMIGKSGTAFAKLGLPGSRRRRAGGLRSGITSSIFSAGLLYLTAMPAPAQTPAADVASARTAPSCRSARAVHDASCPNYTGFSGPIGVDAQPQSGALALAARASDLGLVDGPAPGLRQKRGPAIERGLASWYGDRHHGARTASGEAFSKHALTAAHKTLPLGTRVLVHSVRTGRDVVVRVNDRGPHVKGRIIDLSKAAAEVLGMLARGQDAVVLHALEPVPTEELSGASANRADERYGP